MENSKILMVCLTCRSVPQPNFRIRVTQLFGLRISKTVPSLGCYHLLLKSLKSLCPTAMLYCRVDSLWEEENRSLCFPNRGNNCRTVKPQPFLSLKIQHLYPWVSYNTVFSLEYIYQYYST